LENTFIINDLETLQVIADPLRLSIYQQIKRANLEGMLASAGMLARQLKISQTKLYYHLKMLEKHGLIEVGEVRAVSGIPEKLYRLAAPRLTIAEHLLGEDTLMLQIASGIFNQSLEEMGKNRHPMTSPESNLWRQVNRLSARRAEEFNQRLNLLLEDFSSPEEPQEGKELNTYVLLMALYPLQEKI